MTNLLLLIGLLGPAVHTQTPPVPTTAQTVLQTEAKTPAQSQIAVHDLRLRMSTKEIVEVLGQPVQIYDSPLGGTYFHYAGDVCSLQHTGCHVRFDDSGHATAFQNIKL